MKILVISQYFTPDITAAAFRISESCDLLRKMGHEVNVVTSTPHKSNETDYLDDNTIARIEVNPLRNRTILSYLKQYLGFALGALIKSIKLKKVFNYDVIWVTSPPLFVGVMGVTLGKIVRRPVVLDVRDIWPESAVGIGKIKKGSLSEKCGKILEKYMYSLSCSMTCVSQPMAEYLRANTNKLVTVVYNGGIHENIDSENEDPNPDIFCYCGNLGSAQGLDLVVKAFSESLRDQAMVSARLDFIGDGVEGDKIKALTKSLGIENRVKFYGAKPKRDATIFMKNSGTLLIPLIDSPVFELTVPSKVFDCMALGRPVIAMIKGEGGSILESTGANKVVAPGDLRSLVKAFIEVRKEWERLNNMAPKNKDKIRKRFTRLSATQILSKVLEETLLAYKG